MLICFSVDCTSIVLSTYVYLPIYLSIYPPTYILTWSAWLSVDPSVCLFICSSIRPSTYLPTYCHLPVRLSIHHIVCLCVIIVCCLCDKPARCAWRCKWLLQCSGWWVCFQVPAGRLVALLWSLMSLSSLAFLPRSPGLFIRVTLKGELTQLNDVTCYKKRWQKCGLKSFFKQRWKILD